MRIMYVHVPAATLAMGCYTLMAISALGTLVWRHPLADVAAKAAAPLGAGFTFLGLVTGSVWGKPMWGAWWVWDARLTSFLVLLHHVSRADRAVARVRGPGARRTGGGGADPRRLRQHPDHQSSRSTGGTRCTSRRASCGSAGRASIPPCCTRFSSCWRRSRCCSCRCGSAPCARKSIAAACAPRRSSRRSRRVGRASRPGAQPASDGMTHLGYIVAAYAATAIVLAAMVAVGGARPAGAEGEAAPAGGSGPPAPRGGDADERRGPGGHAFGRSGAGGAAASAVDHPAARRLPGAGGAVLRAARLRRPLAHPLRADQQAGAGLRPAADRGGEGRGPDERRPCRAACMW